VAPLNRESLAFTSGHQTAMTLVRWTTRDHAASCSPDASTQNVYDLKQRLTGVDGSPLSPSLTPSLCLSRLKTYLFQKSFRAPWTPFLFRECLQWLLTGPFLMSNMLFCFQYFSFVRSNIAIDDCQCARRKWLCWWSWSVLVSGECSRYHRMSASWSLPLD